MEAMPGLPEIEKDGWPLHKVHAIVSATIPMVKTTTSRMLDDLISKGLIAKSAGVYYRLPQDGRIEIE